MRILYHLIQKKRHAIQGKLDKVPLVSLPEMSSYPAVKLRAQLIHVKKSPKTPVMTYQKDRTKRNKAAYDRLFYFR
jgi:hypothetical protein